MIYGQEFLTDVWEMLCDTFACGELDYWTDWIMIDRSEGVVQFREEGGRERWRVRRGDLPHGLDLLREWAEGAIKEYGWGAGAGCPSYSLAGLSAQDAGEFDSMTIDTMVQMMTFGEVVYG